MRTFDDVCSTVNRFRYQLAQLLGGNRSFFAPNLFYASTYSDFGSLKITVFACQITVYIKSVCISSIRYEKVSFLTDTWNPRLKTIATRLYQFYTWLPIRQLVSELPSRSLCLCGSLSMVLLLHICSNSVSRSKTFEGVHGYGLHLLDVFSYRGWGRQRDSEVLRSMGPQFGTICHQLCETAVCHWQRSIKGRLKTYLFGRGQ